MQIYFGYDKKKVIQALRYHFIARPEIRVLIILVNVFAIVSAILFYMQKVSPLAFLISSLLWILLMLAFWYFLPNTVYKRASTFQDTFKMNIDDYNVRIETNKGFTNWDWKKFSHFVESPHFVHLYFDSRSFFLIPKEAVENDDDMFELRQLLKSNITKR
jgi:uncharacterized membrane protein